MTPTYSRDEARPALRASRRRAGMFLPLGFLARGSPLPGLFLRRRADHDQRRSNLKRAAPARSCRVTTSAAPSRCGAVSCQYTLVNLLKASAMNLSRDTPGNVATSLSIRCAVFLEIRACRCDGRGFFSVHGLDHESAALSSTSSHRLLMARSSRGPGPSPLDRRGHPGAE